MIEPMHRRAVIAAGLASAAAAPGLARAQTGGHATGGVQGGPDDGDRPATAVRPQYDRYDPANGSAGVQPPPYNPSQDAYDPSRDPANAPRSGLTPPAATRDDGRGVGAPERYPPEGVEGPPAPDHGPDYPAERPVETYSRDEIVHSASDFFGVTAEAVGGAVERVFRQQGRPTGYIAGEEIAAAFIGGLRYGKGLLYMKRRPTEQVYWQGPSVGWDFGGNGSRTFTLCYNLQYPDAIYRRFPGVEGSAYFIGGIGVNYQRADTITLAPMRAGVGLRLGANVGYLAYSRRRQWFPF